MNVEDLAAGRHKEIRRAHEEITKATARHAESVVRLEELRGQIGPAAGRDREALGKALIDGKPEPASEAARIEAEIEQEERNAEALAAAVQTAHGQVAKLVTVNRSAWRRRAMQELGRARNRYENAISELESAREALSDEAMLVAWLDGGAGAEAATDMLGGRVGTNQDGRAAVSFAATLAELRADADALAAHPTTRNDPHPRPRFELARGGVQGMRVSGWGGE